MTTTNKVDVAVFIDFENIYVSVREKFDATPNFESIMDRCEDYGRVVIARAYADWYRYPRITSALFANGIEPMYVPTYYYDKDVGRQGRPIKNSVDMHLCIDAMRTLYSRPNIQRYVLVTGDRDFIPLVNNIRQEGKEVVIIGIGGAASSHLAQSADEFLFYEQIVDIRPMTPQLVGEGRPAERVERRERVERAVEKAERLPEKAERAPEKVERQEEPQTADVYDTLVEAVHLARKRGYVCSFGSLKVLMKELLPNFKESRYRDAAGRPFAKFTDFVREAERQGRVQIFTSGTVNEVFLPEEDPYKLSQFAADLPSAEAEREIEAELSAEEVREAEPVEMRNRRNGRERRRERGRERLPEVGAELELPDLAAEEAQSERVANRSFGEDDWQLFMRAMASFSEPTPFADIFNELRDLRNREELSLTNQELKELLKQAINEGMLQRSNRGAKAHYRLIPGSRQQQQPPVLAEDEMVLPDLDDEEPIEHLPVPEIQELELVEPVAGDEQIEDLVPESAEVAAFEDDRLPPPVEPASDVLVEQPEARPQPLVVEQLEAEPIELTAETAEQLAPVEELPVPVSAPKKAPPEEMKPRRRRSLKKAETTAAEPAAEEAPAPKRSRSRKAAADDAAESDAEEPKTRRRRTRKKAEQTASEAETPTGTAPAAADAAQEQPAEAPKQRRRRRKTTETVAADQQGAEE